jgi:lipoprotein-anchoring transpeptidase ErfK/SrfK
MIRAFAFLFAALTVLAGVGHAQAQERTFYDIFGGGPNFGGGGYGGSSPIQRSTVSFAGGYAPGTIYINTAERRLYLVLGNGQALRYGIGVGRDGIDNPLGARAMYLGSTLYRIHGSNEPETIGQAVSSGCFRMTNEDVTDLYSRVSVGTTVMVKN